MLQITAQIKAEEADLAARIAYETRAELEREEAERTQAKTSLVQFLAGNEVRQGQAGLSTVSALLHVLNARLSNEMVLKLVQQPG